MQHILSEILDIVCDTARKTPDKAGECSRIVNARLSRLGLPCTVHFIRLDGSNPTGFEVFWVRCRIGVRVDCNRDGSDRIVCGASFPARN